MCMSSFWFIFFPICFIKCLFSINVPLRFCCSSCLGIFSLVFLFKMIVSIIPLFFNFSSLIFCQFEWYFTQSWWWSGWGWKEPLEVIWYHPLSPAGPNGETCPGPCPNDFWTCSWIETPQLPWETCAITQSPSQGKWFPDVLMETPRFSVGAHCFLSYSLSTTENLLIYIYLYFTLFILGTFFSPGYTAFSGHSLVHGIVLRHFNFIHNREPARVKNSSWRNLRPGS